MDKGVSVYVIIEYVFIRDKMKDNINIVRDSSGEERK